MGRRFRTARRLAAAVFCAALIAGLAPTAGAHRAEQRQITVAFKPIEKNLTPFALTPSGQPRAHDLTNLVYDTLFWSPLEEKPEPWLAADADPSPDYKSWTVKLRPGVLWHDRSALTAEDVAFSFQKMQAARAGRSGQYPVFVSADVLDPLTVRLKFQDAAPMFKLLPGGDLPIVPKHVWANVANPDTATNVPSIGSGPFRIVEVVPDQMYRLEANAAYFKGTPKVDRIDVPIIKDASAAFTALQAGKVDALDRPVPPELYDQLSRISGIKVVESTRMESVQLHFNTRKPPLSDPRVRKGITLAIDNKALVRTVLFGRGKPGHDGWVHPASTWADPKGDHEFDVARANRVLDEAGFRRGAGGMRRVPGGNVLQFTITVAANAPHHERAAQLITEQVEAIGVQMQVETVDPARLGERRGTLSYDSFISNLDSHAHADPDALAALFRSPAPNAPTPGSFGAYSNPRFDALVDQARAAVKVEERKRLLQEAQRILARDAPALVLFYPNGDYAYRWWAYDGWTADPGHGILTKRSFLDANGDAGGALGGSSADHAPPWAAIGATLGATALVSGLLIVRDRRRHSRLGLGAQGA